MPHQRRRPGQAERRAGIHNHRRACLNETVAPAVAKLKPVILGPGARPRRHLGYTAAVVTPPSTTMVWPVMKVEASEAR